MDFAAIEKQIKKISFMLDTFKADDEVSPAEKELLLDYTRKLYSSIQGSGANIDEQISTPIVTSQEADYVIDMEAEKAPIADAWKERLHDPNPVVESPVVEPEPVAEEPTIETIQDEIMATFNPAPPETEPVVVPETIIETTPIADVAEGMTDLFAKKEITDLSEKLSFSPIADLTKSMGINDRIRVVRELFGGDSELFNTTINRLNKLNNYEEAKSYLLNGVAKDYGWNNDEKIEKAMDFVKLIQRRFV